MCIIIQRNTVNDLPEGLLSETVSYRGTAGDLSEHAVGEVGLLGGGAAGGQGLGHVQDVPREGHAALGVHRHVAVVVVGEPQQLLFGLAMVQ